MEKYKNYSEKEEFGHMTNRQLLDLQQDKIKKQDDQVDELIGVVKKGNILAKDMNTEVKKQNVKLEHLDDDIGKTEEKMVRTRNKFDNYIEKSSFCCLYMVILGEIIALALVLILV